MKKIILIGYSGHAYVVGDIFHAMGREVFAYTDNEEKLHNPFNLQYLGKETDDIILDKLRAADFFISIGDNKTRRKISAMLSGKGLLPINAVHPSAVKTPTCILAGEGEMIGAGVILNPFSNIGKGVICNTGCIIEHECHIGDYSHIGPGAILCGNVTVGENSFVGAGSVVKQGIIIGSNVMIGAGSVVVKNVPDSAAVMGCPAK